MEQLYDYRMVDNCSVVEQAHGIQTLVKELEQFPCVLPNKYYELWPSLYRISEGTIGLL